MNVLDYAALQYEHDEALTYLWHVERDGIHFLLYFKGGGSLSYDAKAAGTESEISRAFDQEISRFESGTYHNEVWKVVSETMDADSGRRLKIFDDPTFGVDWEKVGGSTSDEDQFCDMLEKQINTWKGASHSMPVGSHPYWPKFHEMVKAAVREKYGNSIRLYRGIHGDQAPDILAGVPVKMFRFSSWTSDLSSARVYAAGKTKRGGRDWVVVRRNFSPEEIAFAPVTLSGPCENPDILMRLMQDVEHYGDEFIVSLPQLVPGDYKIAAQPKGTRESLLREYIRHLILESNNSPPTNIYALEKHADSALESSTFFEDMPDLILKQLLELMVIYRRGGIRLGAPVSQHLTGDLDANAEQLLKAKITAKAVGRYNDPYNLRGYNPGLNPIGYSAPTGKLPMKRLIHKDSIKKAILDLIYGKPGYTDALETVRGYLKFNAALIQHVQKPQASDPDLLPVYEMAATQNIEDYKQALDLWDMLQ